STSASAVRSPTLCSTIVRRKTRSRRAKSKPPTIKPITPSNASLIYSRRHENVRDGFYDLSVKNLRMNYDWRNENDQYRPYDVCPRTGDEVYRQFCGGFPTISERISPSAENSQGVPQLPETRSRSAPHAKLLC